MSTKKIVSTDVKKDVREIKDIKETKNMIEIKKLNMDENEEETSFKVLNNFDAYDFYKNYDPSKNKMTPYLTTFEKCSIIGIRSQMIADGSPVLIDIPEGIENCETIARMELQQKKIPLIVCREGREYWRVSDLIDLNPELD
jgi:DNA-directed RNA polymerase subunit K/omega